MSSKLGWQYVSCSGGTLDSKFACAPRVKLRRMFCWPAGRVQADSEDFVGYDAWRAPNHDTSLEIVDDDKTKEEERDGPSPEDPFVLFGSPLHHADGVTTDPQGVGNAVEPFLSAFENLTLL